MSKSYSDKRSGDSGSLASSSDYVSSSTLLSSSTSSNSQTNRETNETRLRFYNLQRRLDELMNDAQALTDSCFVEDALGRQFDKEVAEYNNLRHPTLRFNMLAALWKDSPGPLRSDGDPKWPRSSPQDRLSRDTQHLTGSVVSLAVNSRNILQSRGFIQMCDSLYKLAKWIAVVLPFRNVLQDLGDIEKRIKDLVEQVRTHIPEQKLHYTRKGRPKGQSLLTDLKAYREHFQSKPAKRNALTTHLLDETLWYLSHLDLGDSELGRIYRDLRVLLLRDLVNIEKVYGPHGHQVEIDSLAYGAMQPLYIVNWILKFKERQHNPFEGVSDSDNSSQRYKTGSGESRHQRRDPVRNLNAHMRAAASGRLREASSAEDRSVRNVGFRHVAPRRRTQMLNRDHMKRHSPSPVLQPDWVNQHSSDLSSSERQAMRDAYQSRRNRTQHGQRNSDRGPAYDWRIGHS